MQIDMHDITALNRSLEDVHVSLGEIRNHLAMNEERKQVPIQGKEFADAICQLWTELYVIGKDTKGHNYKYANIATLHEPLYQLLPKHGLAFYTYVSSEANGLIFYARLLHTSGQYAESRIEIERVATLNKMQDLGSALTYLRRYTLSAMTGAVTDEDVKNDNDAATLMPKKEKLNAPKQKPNEDRITDAQLDLLAKLIKDLPEISNPLKEKYKVKLWNELLIKDYDTVLEDINIAMKSLNL